MTYGVAANVERHQYAEGTFATPESEHWLIEYEHEFEHHRRVKYCHHDVRGATDIPGVAYSSPERSAKIEKDMSDYDTVTTLVVGTIKGRRVLLGETNTTCVRKVPGRPEFVGFPNLAEQRKREGGIGVSDFNRSKPTQEGGYLLPPGSQHRAFGLHCPILVSPRRPGRITAGLKALMVQDDQKFEESIDRVRARHPDHCVENSIGFILQDAALDIGKFLPMMGETRMLAGLHRFNEGAGKIKKRKEKSNEHKVRGRSRSRHR